MKKIKGLSKKIISIFSCYSWLFFLFNILRATYYKYSALVPWIFFYEQVCLPSIVEEFLKQAKAAHLFTTSETFIFEDLLESDFSRDFGGLERLDMFFPFDPCLLKKCDRFVLLALPSNFIDMTA